MITIIVVTYLAKIAPYDKIFHIYNLYSMDKFNDVLIDNMA